MTFLVIKLGALGDFVQALGPFSAIRNHHSEARIVLLTTSPYKELAKASGFFDDIWTGGRPSIMNIYAWKNLRKRLIHGGFERVYDLQTSDRSSFYRRLFWPGLVPEWSGIAPNCSHPHDNPMRNTMHTIERQAEQLEVAGITSIPFPDLSALDIENLDSRTKFGLISDYVLLSPLGSARRPRKRWPLSCYAELAKRLSYKGLMPVLLGTNEEKAIINKIIVECPEANNLAGKTSLLDLVSLGFGAKAAVGNDTGPMHIISLTGCSSVVLFSNDSKPALCGQRGAAVTFLQRDEMIKIKVDDVIDALSFLRL
ncbi:MAG: glycosyltransferase family 9 protein [Pseudomonadota bacterium]|nr:glycosyltransferase family 9 protein [Pseudomonadota bacterium]